MSIDLKLVKSIKATFAAFSSEELQAMLGASDDARWSEEAFQAARELLLEREDGLAATPPPVRRPAVPAELSYVDTSTGKPVPREGTEWYVWVVVAIIVVFLLFPAIRSYLNDKEREKDGAQKPAHQGPVSLRDDVAWKKIEVLDKPIPRSRLLRVPKETENRFSEMIALIKGSESMNDDERQYWIDILPIMTQKQIDGIRKILKDERKFLAEIDAKYSEKPVRIVRPNPRMFTMCGN